MGCGGGLGWGCGCILSQAVKQLFVIAATRLVPGAVIVVLAQCVSACFGCAWVRVECVLAKVLVAGYCAIKMQSTQKLLTNAKLKCWLQHTYHGNKLRGKHKYQRVRLRGTISVRTSDDA